jgi:hypothetical protein
VSSSVYVCADEPPARAEAPVFRLGPDVQVAAKGAALIDAINTVFGAMAVDADAKTVGASGGRGKIALTFELRRVDRSRVRLFANGLPIVSVERESEIAPTLEATLVGCAVRRRTDAAAFHAASVEVGGSGVILSGSKGSGKSTLALALANDGARYLGDEVAFVRYEDGALEAFPKAVTLKEGSFSRFADTRTHTDPIRGRVRYHRPKTEAPIGYRTRPELLIFPVWCEAREQVQIDPVPQPEVALELIRQAFGGLERDRRTLALVRRLSELPAYRLAFSDAGDACAAIRRLVHVVQGHRALHAIDGGFVREEMGFEPTSV